MKKMWIKTVVCGFFCCLLIGICFLAPCGDMVCMAGQLEGEPLEVLGAEQLEKPEEDPREAVREELNLYATSAVLLDANSGRVLYGKNENQVMPMASTTKVMTAIVVLEELAGEIGQAVEISAYAAGMPKVKLYAKKGEKYTVRDLLYSLLLESHNDSAVALAEHVGKEKVPELAGRAASGFNTEESKKAVAAFAALMNQKAERLGCKDTYFITPNGLDAQEEATLSDGSTVLKTHATTATELAKIFSYCILRSAYRDVFLTISRTSNYSFANLAGSRSFSCTNHNSFLQMMSGALSGKTGFTNNAGYCYVGALESEGRTFVVALLACGWPSHKNYKWSDTKQLMNYGMEHFFYRDFSAPGTAYPRERLSSLPVEGGQMKILGETPSVALEISNERYDGVQGLLLDKEEQVHVRCRLSKGVSAPVEKGNILGSITYSVGGIIYRKEYIVAAETIGKINFEWCLKQIWERFVF